VPCQLCLTVPRNQFPPTVCLQLLTTSPTEFANKKVVLFSVPGAFTPGCSAKHLPGYIDNLPALKGKGVDIIAVIAYNDAFVMSAWGKANGIKGDDIVCFRSHASTHTRNFPIVDCGGEW
jgi:peroxiredoxin